MRIIAGSRKGHALITPTGRNTRPTLDRIKESMFGILQFELADTTVLDLFSGSGNLGMEALSRGAAFAVFCDHDRQSAAIIRKNIEKLRFEEQTQLYAMDFSAAIKASVASGRRFDIVFLDPPYASELAEQSIELLLKNGSLNKNAIIVVEHDPEKIPKANGFTADTRRHGEVGFTILRQEDGE